MSEAGAGLRKFYRKYRKSYLLISGLEDSLLTPQKDEGKWFLLLERNSDLIRAHYARNEHLLSRTICPLIQNPALMDDELASIIIEENGRLLNDQTEADYLLHDDLATLVFEYIRKRWPLEKVLPLADSLRDTKGRTFCPEKTREAEEICRLIIESFASIQDAENAFSNPESMRKIYLCAIFRRFYYAVLFQNQTGIPDYSELYAQYSEALRLFKKAEDRLGPGAEGDIERARHEAYLTAVNSLDVFAKRSLWDKEIASHSAGLEQYRDLVAGEAAQYLKENKALNLGSALMSGLSRTYSEYISGRISPEDYYAELGQIYAARDQEQEGENSFGGGRLFCHVVVSVEMAYAIELTDRSIEERRKLQRGLFQNTIDYLCSRPQARNSHPYLKATYEYLVAMLPLIRDDGSLIESLFKLTVFQQTETSIHVLMVQLLASAIAAGIFETRPELFAGSAGCPDLNAVLAEKQRILRYIKNAALLHDIGKTPFWDIVDLQRRHITQGEFAALKRHTVVGSDFLRSNPDLRKYADVARDHHRYYNGQGGYPEGPFPDSAYRIYTDIIRIADCIDAGTDTLGRNYSRGKTFDVLLAELEKDAGSLYNPDIASLIAGSEMLKTTLRTITTWGRENIFGRVYQNYIGEEGQNRHIHSAAQA